MNSRWLSAAFLAVALAVTACGGMEEPVELAQVSDSNLRESRAGDVTQALGAAAPLSSQRTAGAPVSSQTEGTCHEECRWRCVEFYPDDPGKADMCTWSCIDAYCGGGPFP